ncbi:hypothetical protein NX722_02270 [Endozoicomonas gorgoniicola]|uniref:Uncharacterized protein n=1 Tax=Endozoicomonas gorgoniicola TaxID=1234144 RepID=A0ABT3MQ40_9GAMM|nr:hypothetical protein [Endozoicomonas gorgoniicola]MCW7551485.1 hypothetical protein [Endozoicomonas gorgoniicola]
MALKKKTGSLALVSLLAIFFSQLLLASETRHYIVLINGVPRQAEVVIERTGSFLDQGSVTTNIEGFERFTYTYSPDLNSQAGYFLRVTSPPHDTFHTVLAESVQLNNERFGTLFLDDISYWLEDSPAVSLDGVTLQLPIYRIYSFNTHPQGSGHSSIFQGYHYSPGHSESPQTELIVDDQFNLVQMSSDNWRITAIQTPETVTSLPEEQPSKESDTWPESDSESELESELDSDYEEIISSCSKLNINAYKKDPKDDDDPKAPCIPEHCSQLYSMVSAQIPCRNQSLPEMLSTLKTPFPKTPVELHFSSDTLYQHLIKKALIIFMIHELRPL